MTPSANNAVKRFLDRLEVGLRVASAVDQRLLVAVSGGADSVALLRGLLQLREVLNLEVAAAHLDHQLRGAESQRDANWVRRLADELGVSLNVERRDVSALAASSGRGVEETARQVRYEFLTETAEAHGCSHLAVAHTADDQAETILHHVLRGTGLTGLRGMPRTRPLSERVTLIRPLLDVTRAEVEAYLDAIGQPYLDDATNVDPAMTRNRLRHQLLPLIEREFNPQVRSSLVRLGRQADAVLSIVEAAARELLRAAVLDRNPSACRLDCQKLASQPRHLIRECFRVLWQEQDWPRQQMGFEEWDRLARLAAAEGAVTLPGDIEARRRQNLLVLRRL